MVGPHLATAPAQQGWRPHGRELFKSLGHGGGWAELLDCRKGWTRFRHSPSAFISWETEKRCEYEKLKTSRKKKSVKNCVSNVLPHEDAHTVWREFV